ncbi:hypothetical protein PgNI_10733 [Pyricularia grisea]|uniref:Zn(2)-C6 fungal-type domain-containing protein n=1 Tax=Pyricularia grisea TaxID=148305 RepID=A0A6P8AYS5_PYRGI|nr:hypothetical protein PgNI_10733 [Pyricularia grisea]TLD07449.1 hypothetical protein PgNI_10733 [Pyricularia grisea]
MNQAPDGRWIRVPSAPTSSAQTSHRNAIRWPEQLQTAHHLDASHQLPGAHYQQQPQPQRPAIPHDHPPYPPRPPLQQQQQPDQNNLGFERTYEVSSEYTVSPSPPSSAHRFQQHTAAPLPPRSPQPQPQQRDDARKMSFDSVLQLPPRRTNARASQACNTCRRLKTKCDMARPCKTCRDRKGDCVYSGSVSKYHDRYSQLLFDGLQHEMAKLQERTEHIERLLGIMTAPALDRALTNSTVAQGEVLAIREQWHPQAARFDPGMQATVAAEMVGRPLGKPPAKIDTRPPMGPNDDPIMINHPTLVQEVLQWPAVSHFVQRLLASEGIQSPTDFPLLLEQQRDRLCPPFGTSESYEKTEKPTTITHYELEPTGPPGPPLPTRIDWGPASGLSGHMSPERAGSSPQGSLEPDFSPETVWKLVQSYKINIQNMHPLMGQEELEVMVNKFLENQSNPAKKQSAAAAKLTVRRLNKRKRSPIPNGQDLSASECSDLHTPRQAPKLTRSDITIDDAVVLCILALGKISSYKERLPDSFSEDLNWQHRLSPAQPEQYPAPISQSYPLPATLHPDQHTPTNPRKHIHDMPGLEYLTQATDIITSQMHACTLKHVQANILAGLYYGQLGRPLESVEQVQQAAIRIQQLIRPEILDQLRLPRSGILLYEHVMPKPNAVKALQLGVEQDVMEHYMAQLYLRRQLNHIHDMLQPSCDPEHMLHRQPMSPTTPLIRAFKQCLDKSEWASERLQFDDNDAPSPNLLQARLRAKYWKALVATFRPVIRAIVNMPYEVPMYKLEENENVGGEANLEDRVDGSLYPLDPMMLEHARQAVKALVESTRAFHAIQDARLIIPDVFGTAHMQWSNLITLVAIYRDPRVGRLVDGVTLRDLFRRTIEFLGVVVHAPSSLSVILRILQRLEMELFDGRTDRIP